MGKEAISKNTLKSRQKIYLFLILTFALSSISYYVMISTGTGFKVGAIFMWSPGFWLATNQKKVFGTGFRYSSSLCLDNIQPYMDHWVRTFFTTTISSNCDFFHSRFVFRMLGCTR